MFTCSTALCLHYIDVSLTDGGCRGCVQGLILMCLTSLSSKLWVTDLNLESGFMNIHEQYLSNVSIPQCHLIHLIHLTPSNP